ncbi:tetratricopeptide repeat protein [Vicingus serpentipes]|uniref:Tetratricopeptide repeat protein n=1 Tax=Vicingus serpentipes TaxID=1926625 RepID=A0A5C6RW77_9FLAO|nr:tetratricopeptide repeat protein [Vicingus serpentipes]TXB65840.1 tetratricopeptide repeat protein [Vicingus serpentipes]
MSELFYSINQDTVINLCKQAILISYNSFKKTSLPDKLNPKTLNLLNVVANSFNNIGAVYNSKGSASEAIKYFLKSLAIKEKIKDKEGIAVALINLGYIYVNQGDIPLAIKSYHRSLVINEEINDKNGIAYSLNNLGFIYNSQGDFEKALEYFQQSLAIREEFGNKKMIAVSLNNIGVFYDDQGNLSAALDYFKRSLVIREEIKDRKGIAVSLNNIAGVYKKWEDYDKALVTYKKSLKIKEEIGDWQGMATSMNNIGGVLLIKNNLHDAQGYITQSLKIAREIGSPKKIKASAFILSELYEKKGSALKALEMYKLYIQMRDSLNNEETQKASAQQQAKYEYEKQKVVDDAEHVKLIAIEKEEKEKQQIITLATTGGLGLVVIFLIFVFNRLRITKQQKLVIETQKQEVEMQKVVVEEAHAELEEKNQEIMDSITYAKRIQNAILPPTKLVKKYLKESFILYKPKDVVAGDFYWMEHNNNKILFAAADCTGHGVPGAMVSVVCNNGLNRSVREYGLTDPGQILNKTREIVIQEFDKSEEDIKDGMDIALCSLEGNKLQYAGAHNPLWIIRNGEIIETKANKQPIGRFDNPEPYITHSFDLEQGDSIYIFSDGYVDQFGGEKGKKFKAKAFRDLLLSIQYKSMEKQKAIIDDAFEAWKGNLEQIDDVCVIGVRI